MSEHFKFVTDPIPVQDHPVLRMWQKISPNPREPEVIEILRTRYGKRINRKSTIYRLKNVVNDGTSIIVKMAHKSTIEKEALIYKNVLPSIPLRSLYCYGYVLDEENKSGWLFLEEALGNSYDESNTANRLLAANFLGILHASSNRLTHVNTLPDHGPLAYLEYLKMGRKNISTNLGNPALKRTDRQHLNCILNQLDVLEALWGEIEEFCSSMPVCIAHGDFISKNVRVKTRHDRNELLLLDWESAGWSVPAVDLGGLDLTIVDIGGDDLEVYRRTINATWPAIKSNTIRSWVYLGIIFRYLAWIQATSTGLGTEWIEDTLDQLRIYQSRLQMATNNLVSDPYWYDYS